MKINLEILALLLLLVVSVGGNFYFVGEIKSIRNSLQLIEDARAEQELVLGRAVGPMEVNNSMGQKVPLEYSNHVFTILYVFSPDCIWCERNEGNIKFLSENVTGNFRFVGISARSRDSGQENNPSQFTFPIFFEPSEKSRLEYGLRSTPSTYLISPDGKIAKLWVGAYKDHIQRDVEAYFNVSLPGLSE